MLLAVCTPWDASLPSALWRESANLCQLKKEFSSTRHLPNNYYTVSLYSLLHTDWTHQHFSDTVHQRGQKTLRLFNIKLTFSLHTTQSVFNDEAAKAHPARQKSGLLLQVASKQKTMNKANLKHNLQQNLAAGALPSCPCLPVSLLPQELRAPHPTKMCTHLPPNPHEDWGLDFQFKYKCLRWPSGTTHTWGCLPRPGLASGYQRVHTNDVSAVDGSFGNHSQLTV